MATVFSEEEKAEIIRLLGWPGNTINPSSLSYNNMITSRFLVVTEYAIDQALKLVERIEALDEKLETAISQSGVKRIDDIEFFGGSDGPTRMDELRKERKRLVRELSQLLDIQIFGGGGSMGNVCL